MALFTLGINMHPRKTDHKWTPLSTGVNREDSAIWSLKLHSEMFWDTFRHTIFVGWTCLDASWTTTKEPGSNHYETVWNSHWTVELITVRIRDESNAMNVGLPWIGPVCPEHPIDAWTDQDLGNLEAKSAPLMLYYAPQTIHLLSHLSIAGNWWAETNPGWHSGRSREHPRQVTSLPQS